MIFEFLHCILCFVNNECKKKIMNTTSSFYQMKELNAIINYKSDIPNLTDKIPKYVKSVSIKIVGSISFGEYINIRNLKILTDKQLSIKSLPSKLKRLSITGQDNRITLPDFIKLKNLTLTNVELKFTKETFTSVDIYKVSKSRYLEQLTVLPNLIQCKSIYCDYYSYDGSRINIPSCIQNLILSNYVLHSQNVIIPSHIIKLKVLHCNVNLILSEGLKTLIFDLNTKFNFPLDLPSTLEGLLLPKLYNCKIKLPNLKVLRAFNQIEIPNTLEYFLSDKFPNRQFHKMKIKNEMPFIYEEYIMREIKLINGNIVSCEIILDENEVILPETIKKIHIDATKIEACNIRFSPKLKYLTLNISAQTMANSIFNNLPPYLNYLDLTISDLIGKIPEIKAKWIKIRKIPEIKAKWIKIRKTNSTKPNLNIPNNSMLRGLIDGEFVDLWQELMDT